MPAPKGLLKNEEAGRKFRKALNDERAEWELTVEEFAEMLGTKGANISLYERGKREPTLSSLVTMWQRLGRSLDKDFLE